MHDLFIGGGLCTLYITKLKGYFFIFSVDPVKVGYDSVYPAVPDENKGISYISTLLYRTGV